MKVLTVIGNRPQFVKAAGVSRHLRGIVDEVVVHTGQHYDRELSQVFFDELDLSPPDYELGIGSGSHGKQTATALLALEGVVKEVRPDVVLVYGDTNSTLAGSLVAAQLGMPLAHVEAGMRSFDRSMPEETNRIVSDRLAGLLLCSTPTAVSNLEGEGISGAILVGDVMADVALELGPIAQRQSSILQRLGLERGAYALATAHRAGNVDDPERLEQLVEVLAAAAAQGPVVFPVHPRTRARLSDDAVATAAGAGIAMIEPLGYLDFTALVRSARLVLTDSGGLQKEAYLAGVPCLTMRENTEWVETLAGGWNTLVGIDADRAREALGKVDSPREPPDIDLYGGGHAGQRIAEALSSWGAPPASSDA